MATEKVEMMLRHAEDAFLDRLQVLLSGVRVDDRTLDELVAQSRLVRRLYIFDRRGRLLHPTAWRDDDAAVFRPLLAQITPGFWDRGGKREVVSRGEVLLVALLKSHGEPVLVAFARDLDALRQDIFEATLGGLESPTIVAILDHQGSPVYSRATLDRAERVLSDTLREGLRCWSVALYRPPERLPGGRSDGRLTSLPVPSAGEPLIRDTLEAIAYPLAQCGFKVETRVAPDLPQVPIATDAVV